jgi:hypothetical protein
MVLATPAYPEPGSVKQYETSFSIEHNDGNNSCCSSLPNCPNIIHFLAEVRAELVLKQIK